MQTLSDVHKRAAYDNIFGFDEDAINPFKDTAESRDQVHDSLPATSLLCMTASVLQQDLCNILYMTSDVLGATYNHISSLEGRLAKHDQAGSEAYAAGCHH